MHPANWKKDSRVVPAGRLDKRMIRQGDSREMKERGAGAVFGPTGSPGLSSGRGGVGDITG